MKKLKNVFSIIIFNILLLANANASTCEFKLDKKQGAGKLYVDNNKAFYVYRIVDNRYGDMEEVYDAINCSHITSGAVDKSNFSKIMQNNKFESFSIDSTDSQKITNGSFSLFASINKNANKVQINIDKANSVQLQALSDLQNYIKNSSHTLNDMSRQALLNDSLLQKMLNQQDNKDANLRKFGLMVANNDYASAKDIYEKKEIKDLVKSNAIFNKYQALTIKQGDFNDVIVFAKNGDSNALSSAFDKAKSDDEYRQAELLLINQIKDKLISVNANLEKGTVSSKTWHESRFLGRDTDEGSVTVNSPIRYQIGINTNMYQPKSTFTVKAKLIAKVTYNGTTTNLEFKADLVGKIGGNKSTDAGNTSIEWMTARAGAGSFMKQNYNFTDVSFNISDVSVE